MPKSWWRHAWMLLSLLSLQEIAELPWADPRGGPRNLKGGGGSTKEPKSVAPWFKISLEKSKFFSKRAGSGPPGPPWSYLSPGHKQLIMGMSSLRLMFPLRGAAHTNYENGCHSHKTTTQRREWECVSSLLSVRSLCIHLTRFLHICLDVWCLSTNYYI